MWFLTILLALQSTSHCQSIPESTACMQFCQCNRQAGSVACHGDPHSVHHVVVLRLPPFPPWTEALEITQHNIPQLPSYAFPHLPLLHSVTLRRNQLHFIAPFAFTQLPALQTLDLAQNDFFEIPTDLFLEMKQLKRLDLSKTLLQDLTGLNRSDFHTLARLDLIDLSACSSLAAAPENLRLPPTKALNFAETGITRITKNRFVLKSEASFEIDLGNLKEVNLNNNSELYIDDEFLHHYHHIASLSICCGVAIAETELVRFNDWLHLVKLVIHSAEILWVNPSHKHISRIPQQLSHLDARNLSLTSFQLGITYAQIQVLHLSMNKLTQLDLNTALKLTELSAAHNLLTRLPSFNCTLPSMRFLDLEANRISSLSLETLALLPNLKVLNLAHNFVHTVRPAILEKLHNLEDLNLASNYIQSISFTHLPSVRSLNLADNWLNSDLGEPLQIHKLVDAPKLTHIDFSNNPELLRATRHCTSAGYQCWPNWMSQISKLTMLTYLNLSNTSLYAFPLREFLTLRHLQLLDMSYNALTTSALEFPWNYTEISISHHARIQTLLLTGNNISSLPVRVASRLGNYAKFVDLRQNPFECDCELPEALLTLANNLTSSHYHCYSPETDTSMQLHVYVNSRGLWCQERVSVFSAIVILASILIPCLSSICCSMFCLWKLKARRGFARSDEIRQRDHSYTLLSRMSPTSEESPVDV